MSKELKCRFCGLGGDSELELGSLQVADEVVAHFFCMLFSSGLPQNGEDEEGILGFLVPDILRELQRGRRLTCTYCAKKGATIGCSEKKCRRSYHYGCGLKKFALYRFTGDFRSYCHQHRDYQQGKGLGETMECPICMDELIAEPKTAVWAPCCNKKSWFHKLCIQKLALSAGYFFKCPLCNDKEVFVEEMQKVGVFVPEKDASWELEPNAYSELERPVICDAPKCRCPEGRKLDDVGTRWEILLCNLCGSSGIHITCGKLPFTCTEWNCPTCIGMLNDSVKRVQQDERERRLRERNSKEKESKPTSYEGADDGGGGASCSKTGFSDGQNSANALTPGKRQLLEVTERTEHTPVKVCLTDREETVSKITYASDSDEEVDIELGEYPVPPHTIIRELEESGEELCKPLEKLKNYAINAHERMHKLRLTETEIIGIARESPSYKCYPIDRAMVMKFFRYNLPLDKMLQVLLVIRAVYSLREVLVANAQSLSSSTKKKSGTSGQKRRGRKHKHAEKTPDIKLSLSKSVLSRTLSSASVAVKNIHEELEQMNCNMVASIKEELDHQSITSVKEEACSPFRNANNRAGKSNAACSSGKAVCSLFSPSVGHRSSYPRSPNKSALMDKENSAELASINGESMDCDQDGAGSEPVLCDLEDEYYKLRLSSSDEGTPVHNRQKQNTLKTSKDTTGKQSPRQPLEESMANANNIVNHFERVSTATSNVITHQTAEYRYEISSNQMDTMNNSSKQEAPARKKRGKYKKRKVKSLENDSVELGSPKATKYMKGSDSVSDPEAVGSGPHKKQSEHHLKKRKKKRAHSYDSSKYIQKTLTSYFMKVADSKVENAGLNHML